MSASADARVDTLLQRGELWVCGASKAFAVSEMIQRGVTHSDGLSKYYTLWWCHLTCAVPYGDGGVWWWWCMVVVVVYGGGVWCMIENGGLWLCVVACCDALWCMLVLWYVVVYGGV